MACSSSGVWGCPASGSCRHRTLLWGTSGSRSRTGTVWLREESRSLRRSSVGGHS
eukprot:COSAG01_NODE_48_length_31904_cov_21.696997_6_plen_55_part_00